MVKFIKKNGKETIIGKSPIKTSYRKDINKVVNNQNISLFKSSLSKTNSINFNREAYSKLLDWKLKDKDFALFLQGPRQVGKTYLLKEFGKIEFKYCLYIDLKIDDIKERLEYLYHTLIEKIILNSDESYHLLWYNIFKNYDNNFEDSGDTLIIIDEIQESPLLYNSIRYINRFLNSRLCITGSYIAITKYKEIYSHTAGDYQVLNLNSLNFNEFLDAMGIYSDYKKIYSIDKSELSSDELNIYHKVEDYYNVYLQIGGYPSVVKEYLNSYDINRCYTLINKLFSDYFSESQSYLTDIVENIFLPETCYLVAKDLITHTDNLQANDVPFLIGKSYNHIKQKKEEKMNSLGWLSRSNIVSGCTVLSDLNMVGPTGVYKYFFNDMGFLTYMYNRFFDISLSDIKGILAENFVYLFIRDNFTDLNEIEFINMLSFYTFDSKKNEIDFLIRKNGMKIGIEVKYNKGNVKSADEFLK